MIRANIDTHTHVPKTSKGFHYFLVIKVLQTHRISQDILSIRGANLHIDITDFLPCAFLECCCESGKEKHSKALPSGPERNLGRRVVLLHLDGEHQRSLYMGLLPVPPTNCFA